MFVAKDGGGSVVAVFGNPRDHEAGLMPMFIERGYATVLALSAADEAAMSADIQPADMDATETLPAGYRGGTSTINGNSVEAYEPNGALVNTYPLTQIYPS